MADVTLTIEGLDKLKANFEKFPEVTKKNLNKAIQASIFEVEKNADDSGDSKNFQFKTPRAKRTGFLALSFKEGIAFSDLRGAIGPTVQYAPYVYFGTSRGIVANPYMDRIANAATGGINKYFKMALDAIINETS